MQNRHGFMRRDAGVDSRQINEAKDQVEVREGATDQHKADNPPWEGPWNEAHAHTYLSAISDVSPGFSPPLNVAVIYVNS